jgi:hypothetical protein
LVRTSESSPAPSSAPAGAELGPEAARIHDALTRAMTKAAEARKD